MGFPRQECWSGWPFPPPGDLPHPGIEPLGHLGSLNQVLNLSHNGMGVLLFLHWAWSLAVIYRRGAMRMPPNQDPRSWRILGVEALRSQDRHRQHQPLAFSKTTPGHRLARGSESGWVRVFRVPSRSIVSVRLFATPQTVACRLLCPWDFPGRNTGVACHFLLQGIFLTQGSSPHLLRWPVDSLPLALLGLRRNIHLLRPQGYGGMCWGARGQRERDPHWILTCAV